MCDLWNEKNFITQRFISRVLIYFENMHVPDFEDTLVLLNVCFGGHDVKLITHFKKYFLHKFVIKTHSEKFCGPINC